MRSSLHLLSTLGLAASLALATGAFAQQQQGGGGQGGGQGGGGGSTPGGGTPGGQTPTVPSTPGQRPSPTSPGSIPGMDQQRSPFETQRPIFLSGRVVMEDGSPPPPNIVIERVCHGVVRPEGYTDSKGRFSFQLGQNQAMMNDASVGTGLGDRNDPFGGGVAGFPGSGRNTGINERDLMGCEIRATLAGFRSEPVTLAGRRVLDNPEIGTLVMRRIANAPGTTISFSSLNAPKDAKKNFEKGQKEAQKEKWDKARDYFMQSTAAYPEYASAWFELGRVQRRLNDDAGAKQSFEKAIEADAKFVSPYLELALLSAAGNNWEEVEQITDKVLKLNPFDFPGAYFYNAVANLNLNQLDDAEKSAKEALKLDPNHRIPKIEHVMGLILARKEDYTGATRHLQTFLQFVPNGPEADLAKGHLEAVQKAIAESQQP
jgi:tetratricopeptide (TPR) repeat protein